ncbi:MAG: rhomboid family intramembrane serine protease [Candidatus Korarchaeota archaeon]|nr:rhomboid family intramembrane serine protease [Candidatus Korarchaeota archaeon]NIU82920.1 rhomboid family intramembrane serine protease [Candidatus Thorarchaeota archaeon]NIW14186.1 rhomboid family intramembrane serine protease [Candidatus Thorarchaeota archaeon]NIW52294.1 rhomboid family intramembrane serine protease [Candidatus Korarchaeota archaeon]
MAFEVRNDRIPFRRQYVSVVILLLNVVMFIVQLLDPEGDMLIEAAFVPASLYRGERLWTIATSMFMHANFIHIFFNMLFFYVVADNCEDAMGHAYFLFTYLISGLAATFLHAGFSLVASAARNIPTLGASGAIAGIIAVYGILFPNNRLRVLLGYIFIRVRARQYILIFFLMQVVFGLLLWDLATTAYFAHLGGFLAGAVCAFVFKLMSEKF